MLTSPVCFRPRQLDRHLWIAARAAAPRCTSGPWPTPPRPRRCRTGSQPTRPAATGRTAPDTIRLRRPSSAPATPAAVSVRPARSSRPGRPVRVGLAEQPLAGLHPVARRRAPARRRPPPSGGPAPAWSQRRGEQAHAGAAGQRAAGEDERQFRVRRVPARRGGVGEQHRRCTWRGPAPPRRRRTGRPRPTGGSTRGPGPAHPGPAAAGRPPPPPPRRPPRRTRLRIHVPIDIGEVGLATRSMWWNRSGRPRSLTRK